MMRGNGRSHTIENPTIYGVAMRLHSIYKMPIIAIALFFGALTLAPTLAVAGERPFKATIEALAVGFPEGVYEAAGIGSGLGKITEAGTYRSVQYVRPGVSYLEGTGTQTATNGDTISFTFHEIVDFNVEPFTAASLFTITGGTEKFAKASGGGTFAASGTSVSEAELALSIEFTGTIKD
jgi:hypothetical protein